MSYIFLRDSYPRARKQHSCAWCGEPIKVGDIYRRSVSTYDGDFQNQAWHRECQEACAEDFRRSLDDTFAAFENERPAVRLSYAETLNQK